ncbi:hypothetical protein FORC066_2204 [Yersinia enterocolitica]|nr:hypothetical protein FORC065_2283 [Yersinia enterocolitica]UXD29416.1 hypothetical protein FORC066_2204 [Yersinia enterocolitica]
MTDNENFPNFLTALVAHLPLSGGVIAHISHQTVQIASARL